VDSVSELVEKLKNEAGVIWQHYFIPNMQMVN
jgi:hypothetical protein